ALAVASLSRNGAPDFTVGASGADTRWFGVVSRINGRWRMVPFDYRSGLTTAIDAAGVYDGLVHAEANPCGCALGPETYSWYRFNGRIFVPTNPPGAAPACTPNGLADARTVSQDGSAVGAE